LAFDLNAFRAALSRDGARPNLFEVLMVPPAGIPDNVTAGQNISFMGRAAQLPGKTIGSIPVYYMGREIKIPGNAVFQEWTLTVINDEDFVIRSVFERWHGAINGHSNNLRSANFLNWQNYSTTASVIQYSKMGTFSSTNPNNRGQLVNRGGATGIRKYNLIGAWPIDVSPIDVDWSANDMLSEFTVTMAYQWWEVENESVASIAARVSSG
jgi:hypothetical protein